MLLGNGEKQLSAHNTVIFECLILFFSSSPPQRFKMVPLSLFRVWHFQQQVTPTKLHNAICDRQHPNWGKLNRNPNTPAMPQIERVRALHFVCTQPFNDRQRQTNWVFGIFPRQGCVARFVQDGTCWCWMMGSWLCEYRINAIVKQQLTRTLPPIYNPHSHPQLSHTLAVVELTFRFAIYSALSILTGPKCVPSHSCERLYIVGAECGL